MGNRPPRQSNDIGAATPKFFCGVNRELRVDGGYVPHTCDLLAHSIRSFVQFFIAKSALCWGQHHMLAIG
jgi:hypothetical protein